QLRFLTRKGISIHAQVVLCPGINDGEHLEKTLEDLASLRPEIESVGVVPIGLTKHRQNLPTLRTYRSDEASAIIDQVHATQIEFSHDKGSRFVWAADEFYVQANRSFPTLKSYEEMSQFENGIGMVRDFLTSFNRRRRFLGELGINKRILILTGHSAYPFLSEHVLVFLKDVKKLKLNIEAVTNRFWGDSVTVSGLLTGQDLLNAARRAKSKFDRLLLPPNCVNSDGLFLDNMSLSHFKKTIGKDVILGSYDICKSIREATA
ncbi:MAG: DUF512 domain-containing protein, partial [candidate division Zixibacteria bacterium]